MFALHGTKMGQRITAEGIQSRLKMNNLTLQTQDMDALKVYFQKKYAKLELTKSDVRQIKNTFINSKENDFDLAFARTALIDLRQKL